LDVALLRRELIDPLSPAAFTAAVPPASRQRCVTVSSRSGEGPLLTAYGVTDGMPFLVKSLRGEGRWGELLLK
jgi:hypothetical protein